MDDSDEAYLARVERERRQREDALLLLLLALLTRARLDATTLALHGYTPDGAIATILARAAPLIARTMAQAHRDGFRRAGLASGTRLIERADAGPLADLAAVYLDPARQAAQAMTRSVSQAISEALRDPQGNLRTAIRDALSRAGYTPDNAYAVDLATERAVVTSHGNGVLAAAQSGLLPTVTGLAHLTVIDEGTTDICMDRVGLKLPVNHPYFQFNVPQLHWKCRSMLKPLFGDFIPSDWLPTIPPMAGFGAAPPGYFQQFVRRAA